MKKPAANYPLKPGRLPVKPTESPHCCQLNDRVLCESGHSGAKSHGSITSSKLLKLCFLICKIREVIVYFSRVVMKTIEVIIWEKPKAVLGKK